jgi:hypothetical protein
MTNKHLIHVRISRAFCSLTDKMSTIELVTHLKYPILLTFAYFLVYYLFVVRVGVAKGKVQQEVKDKWRKKHGDKACNEVSSLLLCKG